MAPSRQDLLLTEYEIKSLLVRERYYRDTFQWKKLRESYHPDASKTSVKITWFEGDIDGFVSGSQKMASGGTVAAHTISPVEIHVDGDLALTESTGGIQIRFSHNALEFDCTSYTRFISRLERVTGEWKLLKLEVIYERDTITPVVPQVQTRAALEIRSGRPSYKCISWLLSQKGFKINQDLPGTDDPPSVAKLMDSNFRWLHQQ